MAESAFDTDFHTYCVPQLNEEFAVGAIVVRGSLISEPIKVRRGNPVEVVLASDRGINARVTMREVILPRAGYGFEVGRDVIPQAGDVLIMEGDQWELFSPDPTSPIPQLISGGSEWRVWVRYRKQEKVTR